MMRLNEVFINGNFEYINKNIFQAVLGLMPPWNIAPPPPSKLQKLTLTQNLTVTAGYFPRGQFLW